MDIIVGDVQSLSKDRHGIKVNGTWYNNKFKTLPPEVVYGGKVTLETKDGKFWDKASASGAPIGAVADKYPAVNSHARPVRQFPIDPLDAQRAIIRQNALSHAVTLVTNGVVSDSEFTTAEDCADFVIAFARMFEAYSAGDIEAMLEEKAKAPDQPLKIDGNTMSEAEITELLKRAKASLPSTL